MVVCADDPELLDKLDQAAEKGELGDVTQIKILYLILHYVVVNLVFCVISKSTVSFFSLKLF